MLDENGIVIPDKPKRPVYFTAQAKRSHVNAFESTGKTMTSYCEVHGIPLSTFSTWITRYGKKQPTAFVPVQVKNDPPPKAESKAPTQIRAPHIEIHRGDLKVVLPVMSDVSMAIQIIKGVFACN